MQFYSAKCVVKIRWIWWQIAPYGRGGGDATLVRLRKKDFFEDLGCFWKF